MTKLKILSVHILDLIGRTNINNVSALKKQYQYILIVLHAIFNKKRSYKCLTQYKDTNVSI